MVIRIPVLVRYTRLFFKGLFALLLCGGLWGISGSALNAPPTQPGGCTFLATGASQTITVSSPAGFATGLSTGTLTKSLLISNESATQALWVNVNQPGNAAVDAGLTTVISQSVRIDSGQSRNFDGQYSQVKVIREGTTGNPTCTIAVTY